MIDISFKEVFEKESRLIDKAFRVKDWWQKHENLEDDHCLYDLLNDIIGTCHRDPRGDPDESVICDRRPIERTGQSE